MVLVNVNLWIAWLIMNCPEDTRQLDQIKETKFEASNLSERACKKEERHVFGLIN